MNKLNKYLVGYFLIGLPILILIMALDVSQPLYQKSLTDEFYNVLNSLLGIFFGSWILVALYISGCLVASTSFRELIISNLIKIKERDERESYIVGQTAKKIFLSSLAVLILLFVLSTLQVNLQENPIGDKKHSLSLGLKFSMWSEPIQNIQGEIFNYGFPLSSQGVLILIIVWQVLSFYYYNRVLSKIT